MSCMPAEEAYTGVARLITSSVKSFQNAHGGDWHELLSDAHLAFAETRARHREEETKLITYLYPRLRGSLLDSLKRRIRQAGRQVATLEEGQDRDRERFDFSGFVGELSEDAQTIIYLAFECGDKAPRKKRMWAVSYLLGIGWAADRLRKALAEIREALC